MSDTPDPVTLRAQISAVAFTYTCPCCAVTFEDQIEAEEDTAGLFVVPMEERFDLCSHCGALLDFGAAFRQEDA